MKIVLILFFIIIATAEALPPRRYFFASFGILCEDTKNPAHLMPLSFIEFKEQIDIENMPAISSNSFTSVAPKTFANLDRRVRSMKLFKGIMHNTDPFYVDALVKAPVGCVAERMVQQESVGKGQNYKVIEKYWDQIPPELQNYYLLEAASQEFLKEDLAPVDFRRFTLYVLSGSVERYTKEQRKFFLEFHGVNER